MTRIVVVEGYTYERYLGYTYGRKRNGRRFRVHHFKTIVVPGYSYEIQVRRAKTKRATPSRPTKKTPKRPTRKTPPPSRPKRKRKPKPKATPKPKPKPAAPAPTPSAALPTPKSWISCAEWQDFVDQWAGNQGFEISWDGDIFKKSPVNDVISRDLFVWPTDRYPRGITLKKYPDVGEKVFYMARLWVLIEHSEDEEMFVWVRTARLRREMDFDEAKGEIEKLSKAIELDVEAFPYLAFRGLIGWTLYTTGTKATRRRKKEGTE